MVMIPPRLAEVLQPGTLRVGFVGATAFMEIRLDVPLVQVVMDLLSWPNTGPKAKRDAGQTDHQTHARSFIH